MQPDPVPAAVPPPEETATQIISRPPPEPEPIAWVSAQDEPFEAAQSDTWFDEVSPEPDSYALQEEPGPPLRRSRKGRVLTAIFLVLAVLGVAGFFGYQHLRDADVRTALTVSTREYNAVVERMTDADDVATVSDVAKRAATAVGYVEEERARVRGRDDALGRAVTAQLAAEQEVLSSLAALVPLSDDALQTWSEAHAGLREAVDDEQDSRAALQNQDEAAATRLADGDEMLEALTATVGTALADEAAGGAVEVLDRLAAASKTAQLREIGDDAVTQQDAVASVAEALDTGSGREVLAAYADVLDRLGRLSALTPGDTGSWPEVRSEVADAAGRLASAAGPQGGPVRASLAEALRATDSLVLSVEQGFARWQLEYDAAVTQIAEDRADLDGYAQAFQAEVDGYEALRESLGDFTDLVDSGDVSYGEAYSFLSQAASDRESVRFGLEDLPVPASVQPQHDVFVGLVSRGIDGVRAAFDGLSESESCEDCDYGSTQGWQSFQQESKAISEQYGKALTGWQQAVAAARTSLEGQALPPEPDL